MAFFGFTFLASPALCLAFLVLLFLLRLLFVRHFGFAFLAPLRRLFFRSRFPCQAYHLTALFIRHIFRWLLIVPHLFKNAVRASRTTENTLKVNKHSQNRALFFITRKKRGSHRAASFFFHQLPSPLVCRASLPSEIPTTLSTGIENAIP